MFDLYVDYSFIKFSTCNHQKEVITTLYSTNPDGRYWLKIDGTDLKVAMQESVKNLWDGDAYIADCQLAKFRASYEQRRAEATDVQCIPSAIGHLR